MISIFTNRNPPSDLGIQFNKIVIPPCVIPSCFFLNNEGIFTIYFECVYYRSSNYETLVEFIKSEAAKLSEYDVIPF